MSPAPGPAAGLVALARLAGVQPSYTGVDEQEHRVDPEVMVAVLRALGYPLERAEDAPSVLAREEARRAERRLEPVVVQRLGEPPVTLPVPASTDPQRCRLTLVLEDGRRTQSTVADLMAPRPVGRMVAPPLGEPLPPGYHELVLEGPTSEDRALLVVAPRCPAPGRGWGLFAPLHGLRTDDDWGAGAYPDLAEVSRWVGERGGSFVGTLPLYPSFLDDPADPSPYLPVSRLGWSEVFLDVASLPELDDSPGARAVLAGPSFGARVADARRAALVPYEELFRLRREVLEPLAVDLVAGRRGVELRRFATDRPELFAYARFRAAAERFGRDRSRWPQRTATELARLDLDHPSVAFYLCAQWLADRQLSQVAAGAPLYVDMPVGVHPDGFDPFFEPEAFATGVRGGAPPDPFYAEGQDWSIPPLHPVGLREQRYRHLRALLANAFRHARALRIDHVMGLHRLYWIPPGFDPKHGAYVSYAGDELHAVVCLEAHRAGAAVVGEDLGTVEPTVRRAMARDGMLRSWVLQFETSAKEPFPEPPPDCLASFGTHDTPRFAGYYRGAAAGEPNRTEELLSANPPHRAERTAWRRALAEDLSAPVPSGRELRSPQPSAAERAALEGCLTHLAAGPAELVLADLGDLLGDLEQENRPGPVDPANWRHRLAVTLREIEADPGVEHLLALVDRARRSRSRQEVRSR